MTVLNYFEPEHRTPPKPGQLDRHEQAVGGGGSEELKMGDQEGGQEEGCDEGHDVDAEDGLLLPHDHQRIVEEVAKGVHAAAEDDQHEDRQVGGQAAFVAFAQQELHKP